MSSFERRPAGRPSRFFRFLAGLRQAGPLGRARGEAGFTLLEVIIALAIMVVAFASIMSVESNSLNASARGKQMNIVAMLAKDKMVDMEYFIEGKSFDETPKEGGGAFPNPYEDYRWTYLIKEIKFPNLAAGAAKGDQGTSDAAEQLTKLVTNYLSKAVREMTVTIYWKRGSGEQSFSVSTYWVDLNHEFELSPS